MIFVLISLVIGATSSVYVMRYQLERVRELRSTSSTIASIVNAIQIQAFNLLYQSFAVKLTDMENHRTYTGYEDSMIAKQFLFQFVNSYASFVFIAFVAKYLIPVDGTPADFEGQCGSTDCMETLAV